MRIETVEKHLNDMWAYVSDIDSEFWITADLDGDLLTIEGGHYKLGIPVNAIDSLEVLHGLWLKHLNEHGKVFASGFWPE